MSLVLAVLTEDYIVAGSDTKANFKTRETSGLTSKVFRINDDMLVGIAGDIDDNITLFSDYLEYGNCEDNCIKMRNTYPKDRFVHTCGRITKKMDAITPIRINGKYRNIHSFICGWNGRCLSVFEITVKRGKVTTMPHVPYQCNGTKGNRLMMLWCGSKKVKQHAMHFEKTLAQLHKIDNSAIDSIQEAFRITLDTGVLIDKTINSRPVFEIVTMDNVYSQ